MSLSNTSKRGVCDQHHSFAKIGLIIRVYSQLETFSKKKYLHCRFETLLLISGFVYTMKIKLYVLGKNDENITL